MARRRLQEGSVFKRGARKKVWVGRWGEWVRDDTGKLKRILRSEVLGSVSELSKSDAKDRLRQRLDTVGRGNDVRTEITFKGFVERWWKPAALPLYKVSTRLQAEQALKNHLLPQFGDLRLTEISKPDVQAFFGRLVETLAPDTVHGIHRYLRRILSCAMEWGYVSENAAKGVRLPVTRRREPPFITGEQFQQLIQTLPEKVRLMVLLGMMTSMRVSEILGLRWGRIDFQRGVIRVVERCYRGDFSTVKSRRSERMVPLSPLVERALKAWMIKTGGKPDSLVFATRSGKPLSDGNLLRRVIYPACDAIKIPRLSWHLFRHLHGSLLAQLGVHVAVAQAQLGHADPRITLGIYTHVMPDTQREAVKRLENFLMFPNVPKLALPAGTEGVSESV